MYGIKGCWGPVTSFKYEFIQSHANSSNKCKRCKRCYDLPFCCFYKCAFLYVVCSKKGQLTQYFNDLTLLTLNIFGQELNKCLQEFF